MAFGTAPRKINGVWYTRTGKKLGAKGQTYWSNFQSQGRTDGQGHVVSAVPASAKMQTPTAKPGGSQPQPKKPSFDTVIAAKKGDKAAQRQIRIYTGHQAAKNTGFDPKAHLSATDEAKLASLGPAGTWGGKLTGGLAKDVVGLPAGAYFLGRHPVRGAEGIASSYKQMVRHPVRLLKEHPDQFLLNLLPAYGAAGKVAVGAEAARAAEGGALAKAAAGAKAAVRMTPRQVRSVKLGGVHVPIPKDATPADAAALRKAQAPVEVARFSSRNKLTNSILTGRDKNLMKTIESGGVTPSGASNVGSPHAAFGRELSRQYQSRLNRAMAPAAAFERFARGKQKLTPVEEKAVEMAARGHTAETFVKAHLNAREQAIAKLEGAGPNAVERIQHSTAHHGAHAELAQQAGALLHTPTPKLTVVLDEARALVAKRERDLGMTPDEVAHSIGKAHDEIAAMAAGRKSLAQTIAELEAKIPEGKTSPVYLGKRARVARLQAAYDRALARSETRTQTATTRAARIATDRPVKTVERDIAQLKADPSSYDRRWAHTYTTYAVRRLGELKKELAIALGERKPPVVIPAKESPTVTRLGSALSVAKDELGSHEKLLATRGETAQKAEQDLAALHEKAIEIGKQAQAKGAFYVPFKTTHPLRSGPAAARSPVGIGPPKIAKVKPLTGSAFRQATYRTDTARLLANASREGARVAIARHYWPKILSLSKDTEEAAGGKFAIPMRVTTKIPDEYRQAVIRPLRGDLNPQQAADAAHAKELLLQQWRFPSKNEVDPATGTIHGTNEKVRYVDRRLVSGLLVKARAGGVTVGGKDIHLGAAFDTINAVPKLLTLAKPGYALNRVQQLVQNLSQQGVFLRANGQFVKALHQQLNPADLYELQAMAGVGRSRILAPEAGALKKTVTKTAEFMGRHTDDASRMLALAHELRTAGLNTPEKVRAALRDTAEKTQIKLDAIQTRVNQEAIPFGKMSDAEARTIARVFFFWPWTRAALEWTARFPFEHPVQASVGGNVGNYGADQVKKRLGPVPDWARGLIPLTGGRSPLTVNLGNLNTAQTLVDTAGLAKSFGTKSNPYSNTDSPASQLGPGAAGLYGLFSGTNRGRGSYAPLDAAWRSALGSIPELQVSQRLNKPATSVYPGSVMSAIGTPFGGSFPRKTNLDALNKQAKQARAASLKPAARAYATTFDQRNTTIKELNDLGIGKNLPAPVKQAYNRMAQRDAAWAEAAKGKKPGTRDYYVSRYMADLSLAERWGALSPKQTAQARDWAAHAPIDDIKSAHRHMSDAVYDKQFAPARETQKWADEQTGYKADLEAAVKAGTLSDVQEKRALAWARKQNHTDIHKARLALERLQSAQK